jgi:hypothetical protein
MISNLWNSPGLIALAALSAVHVICVTTSLTGPSSVEIGFARCVVTTTAVQPGIVWVKTSSNGGVDGSATWSFVVLAVVSSLGTRNAISTSLAPLGALSGATVTWAQAGAADAMIPTARTPITTAIRRTINHPLVERERAKLGAISVFIG